MTRNNGIVQNLKKLGFGQEELKFVGFWLGREGVQPTEEMRDSITNFPRPNDITV